MSTLAPTLTPEQLEAFGQELDAIRARVVADLGERDAEYINKVIRTQRGLEVAGRGLLFLGFLPPAWYGVALHDLEAERIVAGETSWGDKRELLSDIWRKVRGQTLKDYLLFPALSGPSFPLVLAGNATANFVRNLWSFTIIFCGHFPDGTHEFTEEEEANETRGQWYYRQLLGSANLTGGKLFHILSGNLSHQIEHHLFPDLPAHRYAEISRDVREACDRYGIPYNAGPLSKQFGSVVRKI